MTRADGPVCSDRLFERSQPNGPIIVRPSVSQSLIARLLQ